MPPDAPPPEAEPILVVEDDRDLRDSLCDLLRDEGFTAVGAADGQDALTWLEGNPPPRLVLLDLMMPVMSGAELRDRMLRSEVLRGIPVVILSALDVRGQQGGVADAHAYLKKPIDAAELLEAIAQLGAPRPACGART
ncbi:MAG: hypothetical protein NVSMB23_23070 [Myxococcales bacterium]